MHCARQPFGNSKSSVTAATMNMAVHLAQECKPRVCPLTRLLRACGQLKVQIRLPTCLSLGVAGRDTSWRALWAHLLEKRNSSEADEQVIADFATVQLSWSAFRRRFRRRGIRTPRQLLVSPLTNPIVWLVPERMHSNPPWLDPFRRILRLVDARTTGQGRGNLYCGNSPSPDA